jgi:hypothetical protein
MAYLIDSDVMVAATTRETDADQTERLACIQGEKQWAN